jgi:hypothetical protein
MSRSFVVTGGGCGVGRAMVERLLADGGSVVAIELDPAALNWTDRRPAGRRVLADAADPAVAGRAADLAQAAGTLAGWSTTPRCSATPGSTPRPLVRCWTLSPPTSTLPWSGARPRSASFWRRARVGRSSTSPPTRRAGRSRAPCRTPPPRRLSRDSRARGRLRAARHPGQRRGLGSIATERYQAFLAGQEPTAAVRVEEELGRHRSAGSGVPRRSPRPSPGCSRMVPATSTAPPCQSTAGGRCWARTQKRTTLGRRCRAAALPTAPRCHDSRTHECGHHRRRRRLLPARDGSVVGVLTRVQALRLHYRPPRAMVHDRVPPRREAVPLHAVGYFDPRARKLLSWPPRFASAQLRACIGVQDHPLWTRGVVGFGGQLGGQPRHALAADTHAPWRQVHQHEHTHVTMICGRGSVRAHGRRSGSTTSVGNWRRLPTTRPATLLSWLPGACAWAQGSRTSDQLSSFGDVSGSCRSNRGVRCSQPTSTKRLECSAAVGIAVSDTA